jgi:transglutaminase-like putative cysteine protease
MPRSSAFFTLTTLCLASAAADGGAPRAAEERRFAFEYRAVVQEIPAGARRVDVWLPYPRSDEHQVIRDVEVEAPGRTEVRRDPEFGNSILHVTLERPAPPKLDVALRFEVQRQEWERRDLPARTSGEIPAAVRKWLEPDRLVPLSDRIRKLATEITAGKPSELARARAIYDHVVETMRYDKSGTGWGNGDIYWACDAKRGNCTDFHALFIGLARAAGIPAKFAIGFPLPAERGGGEIAGYHCWAEFYLAGYGWVPVDTSEASKHPEKREYFFGAHDENRVQLSVGRDIVLAPPQRGEPLNYFIYPYVEVDGKPVAKVERSFRFRDLAAAPARAGG